ncbi:Integrin alpha-6 VLA-6, partial [Takifugu flavidus]
MEAIDDFPFPIDDPRETGDIDHFNPELIPLLRNSYLGFSIDSGLALIRKGELTIISGAPRGGYSGQVAFLRPDPRAKRHLSVELVLSGPGLASSFGYDVAVADFNDIAVGAPYDGSGRVYLYCGSSNGINTKAAQVLSSRSRSVTLFGYSLSGNLDVDDNLYPDLAVGSLSDSVFVYRARPVVRVSSTLRVTPDNIDITKEQCDKLLNYTFEADIRKNNVRLPPRVGFLGVPRVKLELPGQDMEICTDIKLRLLRDFKDRLHSIPVSVTMSLGSSTQWTSEHVTPILARFQPNNKVSEITLLNRGCGSDNICQSNLHLQYDFCSRQTENGKSVFRSLSGEDGVAVITPTEEDIALELTVTNWGGDDAHQTRTIISLPDTLRYSDIVSTASEPKVDCTVNDKGTLIDCGLGNPIQRDAEENSAGKWLLYLSHTSSKGVQSVPCSPVNEIDHLKDVKTCTDGLRCVEIHCPLQGLDRTAMVVLHSRLWNTTFLEVKLTVFMEREIEYFTKVAWWIIFLTVIALLLLLAMMVFLLSM